MPLDPSIFMQGAALENQRAQNLQAQLSNAVKLYADGKAEKAKGLDVVKIAEAAAYKKASGLEVTPEEDALAMGWDKIKSAEVGIDVAGRTYQKQQSIFGGGGGGILAGHSPSNGIYSNLAKAAGQGYTPSYSEPVQAPAGGMFPTLPNMSTPKGADSPEQYNTVNLDDKALNDLFEGQVPSGLDTGALMPQNIYQDAPIQDVGGQMMGQSGVASSPVGQIKTFEKGLDLQGKKEETALGAAGKQAEAYAAEKGKAMAEGEAKVQGLNDLNEIFTQMREDAKGTSSGMMEYAGGKVADFFNVPTPKSKADAKFGVGKGFGALNTRLEYLKGQGTVSDSEAKSVLTMLPDPSDPLPIKEVKLESAQQYLSQLLGRKEARKPDVSQNPGFKYLGVE